MTEDGGQRCLAWRAVPLRRGGVLLRAVGGCAGSGASAGAAWRSTRRTEMFSALRALGAGGGGGGARMPRLPGRVCAQCAALCALGPGPGCNLRARGINGPHRCPAHAVVWVLQLRLTARVRVGRCCSQYAVRVCPFSHQPTCVHPLETLVLRAYALRKQQRMSRSLSGSHQGRDPLTVTSWNETQCFHCNARPLLPDWHFQGRL